MTAGLSPILKNVNQTIRGWEGGGAPLNGPLGVPTRPKCVPEEGPLDPFPPTSKVGGKGKKKNLAIRGGGERKL